MFLFINYCSFSTKSCHLINLSVMEWNETKRMCSCYCRENLSSEVSSACVMRMPVPHWWRLWIAHCFLFFLSFFFNIIILNGFQHLQFSWCKRKWSSMVRKRIGMGFEVPCICNEIKCIKFCLFLPNGSYPIPILSRNVSWGLNKYQVLG